MNKAALFRGIIIISVFTGCSIRNNYYLNAFNGNSSYYHAIPLKSDSVTSANYVSGNFALGSANYLHDGVFAFTANFHRSNSFSVFQAYYGVDVSAGSYHVSREASFLRLSRDTPVINAFNSFSGRKSFGSYGFTGGINVVIPFIQSGSEWRVIGIETSLQNEFGSYLKFRKTIPDSLTVENMKSSFFPAIGITSEFVSTTYNGSMGYKAALGMSLKKETYSPNNGILADYTIHPFYFTQTLHFTNRKWTIFGQLTIATYSFFVQTGFNYQLGGN